MLLPQLWIKPLWEFTSNNNIQILGYRVDLKLKQDRDQFLIESFYNHGFKKKKLKILNKYHLYLQVLTTSNITNRSGDQINK